MTAPLPLCVIGGGSIGMRHVEVAATSPRIRLTAVVEPHAPRRAELAALGLPVCATLDEVARDTSAAIIATPTPDHCASTLAALDRGWPVIVEKPIAATLDEARCLCDAAATRGVALFVGHHRRCHPFAAAARDAFGELGDLVGIQGLWSLRKHDSYFDLAWHREPGAGPLLTNLSHEIDLLQFLVGEITEVSAILSSARRGLAIEDTAALAFRFASGALGSFLISDAGASPWAFEAATDENPQIAASGQDYIRATGTNGALEFPSLTRWRPGRAGEIDWRRPLAREPGPDFARVDPLRAQINRFAAVVAGGQDDVLCTAAEGMAALEITLATAMAGQTGRPATRGAVPGTYNGT